MSAETKLRTDHLPKSMEISKSLQEEIFTVQNKLQNAILEHQTNVKRLKEDPENSVILAQIRDIQVYIVSLGRCQKQIVQRLRKEVEASKAENANGSKVSIPSLLGLNNNNHITNNNETKHETAANGFETKSSKEDYEEIVRNGDVHHPTPQDNSCPKRRPSSVETLSGEDDIVEMSMDESSNEKEEAQQEASQIQEESSEIQQEAGEMQQERSQMQKKSSFTESPEQQNFLYTIGLITKSKCIELQNKRVERKRRSTANPHFVYSMLEQPSKRKRHSYLQSGNAPHTRQTTARMNGPSPPPNKTQPTKSISPPTQTITKALIPFQKSSTRPNILRNADSKIFGKSKIEDSQVRSSASSAKSVQSIGNKAVHIPGLPASLTIERIGSDSIVCVSCRNPGSLTICKNCSSNYHVSCHKSPVPLRICPKCALTIDEEEDDEKDEDMEVKGQIEGENKLQRYKKNEKLEEKERERYELRERNSDLRLQVYELEKRSQLLGQSLQLQQRMRQELVGKQEKTQKSIKRLVDFIKLIQLRKNTPSPPPQSSAISCPPQTSSSHSPPFPSTSQKTTTLPPSSIPNSNKTSYLATLTASTSTHDRASLTSESSKVRCPTPTNCPTAPPSNQKSSNHSASITSSRKSPNRLEGTISLLTVKPNIKTVPKFSAVPVPINPIGPLSTVPQSPCSTIVASVARSRSSAQSHSTALPHQNCQILFSPSRTTISWIEQLSTAESPGSHAANSSTSQQPDLQQKSYCLPTATLKAAVTSNCSTGQSQLDQRRIQEQQRVSFVMVSSRQESTPLPSSTHCSQAITSPIPSPIVHASHEASAQTIETIRSCDSTSVAENTDCCRANSQTATSQQQSSSSGVPSPSSSST